MQIMLLCGGEGKRLWPLSNENLPKQFIKCIKYENEKISMLQRTYKLVSKYSTQISIITSAKYIENVNEQIENADIIVEPEARNTFPAVMLGIASSIYTKKLKDEELVAYLPVDAYTDENFYEVLNQAAEQMNKQKTNIGLIGIKSKEPSCDYGYIINEKEKVKQFIEKPNLEKAKELIAKDALYNSGIFILRIGYFKEILGKYTDAKNYEEFINSFSNLPKISFDYEILEKEKGISCIETTRNWFDIGIYKNLEKVLDIEPTETITKNKSNNVTVISETDIPIRIEGVNDLLVIVSKNGILIQNKSI